MASAKDAAAWGIRICHFFPPRIIMGNYPDVIAICHYRTTIDEIAVLDFLQNAGIMLENLSELV